MTKTSSSILIKNGTIITVDPARRILEKGYVKIKDDRITEVGETKNLRTTNETSDKVIDAFGKAVLPGLISGHTHCCQSLMRGTGEGWWKLGLEERSFRITRKYNEEVRPSESYQAALLSCLEMIKAGIACFGDLWQRDMDQVARAVQDSGMRACIAQTLADQPRLSDTAPLSTKENLKLGEGLVRRWHNKVDGRITCMFNPHSLRSASPELILKCREFAHKYNIGIIINVSEVKDDVTFVTRHHLRRPVELLNDLGVLGADVIANHSVWVNDHEIKILKQTGTNVVHNPASNLKLASGLCPVVRMIAEGVNVGLGVDGPTYNNTQDVLQEMRLAALVHSLEWPLDPGALPPEVVLEMATINNARAMGMQDKLGSIEPGKKADITILDLRQPHFTPTIMGCASNLLSNIVYCANGRDVDTTIVDGVVLMEHRKVLSLDEDQVIAKAQELGMNLTERIAHAC